MFTNGDLLGTLSKIISKCPGVKVLVYDGKPDDKVIKQVTDVRDDIKVIHMDEVRRIGREKMHEARKAERDDIYCCMYTSGSSKLSSRDESRLTWTAGTPKGVLLSHGNVLAASESYRIVKSSPLTGTVASVWTLLYDVLNSSDTFLAFLPLAHILEFVVEMSFIFAGLPIGYGRVKTLNDASVRDCKGDIAEFKPVSVIQTEGGYADLSEHCHWCASRVGVDP